MAKRETELKTALMHELRSQLPMFVHLRHEDKFTSGHPDISITGLGLTTWLEAKHGNPDFATEGIQELTMLRLAGAGRAWYIIWHELRGVERTLLVRPQNLATLQTDVWCVGFNHRFVCDWIWKGHHAV